MQQYFLALGKHVNVGSDMHTPLSSVLPLQMNVKTAKTLLTQLTCTEDEAGYLRLQVENSLARTAHNEALRLGARIVMRLFKFERTIAFDDTSEVNSSLQAGLEEDGFQLSDGKWLKKGHFSRTKKATDFLALYQEPLWVPWNYSPLELDVVQYFLEDTVSQDNRQLRVLDIGSGYGKNALFLEERGYDMYGIDVSEIAIEQSQQIVQHPDHFQVASATAIPHPANYFDTILDIGCIHCSDKADLVQIMSEIHRVLKPKGQLYSRIFTPRTKEWMEQFAFKMYDIGLTLEEIEQLMKNKFQLEILEATPDSTYLRGTKI